MASCPARDLSDEIERQDELFPLMFLGSNPDGSWTSADWLRYYSNRSAYWSKPELWDPDGPVGWELFALHVERLASHYSPAQRDQFMRDFGLVFAGIPSQSSFASASWSVRYGAKELQFLGYSNEGLPAKYLDGEDPSYNQTHHYAGIFVLAHFSTPYTAMQANLVRDLRNFGDIYLGEIAAAHYTAYDSGVEISDLISLLPEMGK